MCAVDINNTIFLPLLPFRRACLLPLLPHLPMRIPPPPTCLTTAGGREGRRDERKEGTVGREEWKEGGTEGREGRKEGRTDGNFKIQNLRKMYFSLQPNKGAKKSFFNAIKTGNGVGNKGKKSMAKILKAKLSR